MKATSSAASLQPSAESLFQARAFSFVHEHEVARKTSRRGAIGSLADAIAGEAPALAALGLLTETLSTE
ncbi:MAG: hypothetical protein ABIW82_09935 [Dokdonella sp.]